MPEVVCEAREGALGGTDQFGPALSNVFMRSGVSPCWLAAGLEGALVEYGAVAVDGEVMTDIGLLAINGLKVR